jgi:hypothetical protein
VLISASSVHWQRIGTGYTSAIYFRRANICADYHTTSALHDPSPFGAYAQPHYAPHTALPPDLTGTGQDSDFTYAAASEFSQRPSFAGHRSSILDIRLREPPEVTSATLEGTQGTHILLYMQTLHDLFALPTLSFSLILGAKRIEAVVQPVGDLSGPLRQYAVSGIVPSFISTGCYSFSVPLSFRMGHADGTSPPQDVLVGHFTYNTPSAPSNNSRKRKASDGSDYESEPIAKKITIQQFQLQDENVDSFDYNQTSPYSPFVPTPTSSTVFTGHTTTTSPRLNGHHYSTSSASQVTLTAPSPHTPAWSPSFTTVKTEQSPHPPLTPVPRPASTSAVKEAIPKLVRTSTIQQSPSLGSTAGMSMHTQSFNPYAMYPLKATLKLNGDLDTLAKNWTSEEFDARRRLVEFSRSQNGSTITASFKVVAPEERSANNITISCIWWKEKKECFVTSVDTIYLLEALVGVRFTVEEKNRIRRNLEGFRPLTVSKAKSDSEDFFKCIMGFPNPKPRNIEKDVKVFPWKILSHALKKIISKYSASYSSTASALLTPAASTYASTDVSADYMTGSPHTEFVTSSMSAYPITTTAGYSPRMMSGRLSAPITTASVPDLRLQMPTSSSYNIPTPYGFQPMPRLPHSSTTTPHTISAPASLYMPQSWAFGSTFVNESPASLAPSSASVTTYARGIESADFVRPSSYSMNK